MCCGGAAKTSAATVAACAVCGLALPDARGRVRWPAKGPGVWWRGLPMPLRAWVVIERASAGWSESEDGPGLLALARALRKAMREDGVFEGCGCIDVLKSACERMWKAISRKR